MNASTALLTCISEQILPATKSMLEPYAPIVADAEEKYDLAIQNGLTHTLNPATFSTNNEKVNKELQKVYKDRMAKLDRPGRPIYDELKLAAKHCPFCGHLPADEIDHYLPKDRYQLLATAPLNLVPVCMPCNYKKRNRDTRSPDQVFLHPYYDEIAGGQWLSARVEEGAPASVTFFVNAPDHWTPMLTSRVKYHFEFFGINALYAAQAVNELSGIKLALSDQFNADGPTAVLSHLELMARSRSRPTPNRWDAAMYRALAECDWYYNGGFNEVP